MASGLQSPKAPKSPQMRKQRSLKPRRRDYKRKRDEAGRFSSTGYSVTSRRRIRAIQRNTSQGKHERRTRRTIYNDRGGLKSQKAMRSAQKRKFVRKNRR